MLLIKNFKIKIITWVTIVFSITWSGGVYLFGEETASNLYKQYAKESSINKNILENKIDSIVLSSDKVAKKISDKFSKEKNIAHDNVDSIIEKISFYLNNMVDVPDGVIVNYYDEELNY
ncbi:MAG: hypothetical protein R3E95_15280 [Thiolinea sp.]